MSRRRTSSDSRSAGDGSPREPFYGMVGRSPAMREVYALIERVARARIPVPVLILGETGTGKELAARAIWSLFCPNGPFIPVNCGALSKHLVESELFGHEKGAFTGAERRHIGYLGQADGGILFLDEVAELDLQTQVKLLRAIEEKQYQPVGAERIERSDFRVLAATNQDLAALVAEGAFRVDLFYRLDGAWISLPPLRDRREDLPSLVESFLSQVPEGNGDGRKRLSARALDLLRGHGWPGNVRELRNVVETAAALAPGALIDAAQVAETIRPPSGAQVRSQEPPTLAEAVREFEKAMIEERLQEAGGNQDEAARSLGISRTTLYRKRHQNRRFCKRASSLFQI